MKFDKMINIKYSLVCNQNPAKLTRRFILMIIKSNKNYKTIEFNLCWNAKILLCQFSIYLQTYHFEVRRG